MYCFTSASGSSLGAITVKAMQDSVTSTAALTVVVISNIAFARAGTMASGSVRLFQVSSSAFACFSIVVGGLLYL
jgi:hypothetical protein